MTLLLVPVVMSVITYAFGGFRRLTFAYMSEQRSVALNAINSSRPRKIDGVSLSGTIGHASNGHDQATRFHMQRFIACFYEKREKSKSNALQRKRCRGI